MKGSTPQADPPPPEEKPVFDNRGPFSTIGDLQRWRHYLREPEAERAEAEKEKS